MFRRVLDFMLDLRDRQRIAIAVGKGQAGRAAREVDATNPASWEFSGFSQNGEDGILDVLRRRLLACNRYFIEIGAADGIENNTAWLLVVEGHGGLMVEGNPSRVHRAQRTVVRYGIGAEIVPMFVTRESASRIVDLALHSDPDVFSLDIDGNDYHIATVLLEERRLRPKIVVVEYNSVFGPERSLTIPYADDFIFSRAHSSELYYGVSLAAWRGFFDRLGYRFVTVDRNGINAFFVDPEYFAVDFLEGIVGTQFAENAYQRRKFREPSARQFLRIEHLPLIEV
jgi:hypothetical protein